MAAQTAQSALQAHAGTEQHSKAAAVPLGMQATNF